MIVKVQLPLYGDPQILIYNEDRSYMKTVPPNPTLAKLIGKSMKGYFEATVDANGNLVLGNKLPTQPW